MAGHSIQSESGLHEDAVFRLSVAGLTRGRSGGYHHFAGHGRAVALTAAADGRGGSSLLAVTERKGTIILLALGRARWASEIRGVISLPPLWLTWDLARRGRWLSLIRPLLGNSGRQGRALG